MTTTRSKRMIRGILGELEICSTIVFCSAPKTEERLLVPQTIEIRNHPESLSFQGQLALAWAEITCEAVFYSKRIRFTVARLDNGRYAFPTEIKTEDLRKNRRFPLHLMRLNAEIYWSSGVVIGVAHDISADFVAILSPTNIEMPARGETLTVVIKSRSDSPDIFYGKGVFLNKLIVKEGIKYVIKIEDDNGYSFNGHREIRDRPPRHTTSFCSIVFRSHPETKINLSGHILVTDISLTGFSGEFNSETAAETVPIGLVMVSSDPEITFYPIRREGKRFGFRVHTNHNNSHANQWSRFISKYDSSMEFSSNLAAIMDLAELFTESTFLKNSRRAVYGSDLIESFNSESTLPENLGLIRRFGGFNSSPKLHQHISTFRFCDNCWFLQEVSSTAEKKQNIDLLANTVLRQLAIESKYLKGSPRFFIGIFDDTVEKNKRLWSGKNASIYLPAFHVTTPFEKIDGKHEGEFNFLSTEEMLSFEKAKFSRMFPQEILDALDFWSITANNRTVNQMLSRLGDHHKTYLEIILDKEKVSALGLAYRLKSHYSHNITGVVNALFIFCLKNFPDPPEFLKFIKLKKRELVEGTTDVVFVDLSFTMKSPAINHIKFCWFLIDLLKQRLQSGVS